MSLPLDVEALEDLLERQRRRWGVVGAVAGLTVGSDQIDAAVGTARLGARIPVTTDTSFLLASVTKVWTATLVLQLFDEGLLEPDAPVAAYLDPPLRLADMGVARRVTIAQLLSHTGGFFGDAPEPDFRDDDAVRQLVATYAHLPQVHRPGSMFSYSNAGYIILGRLIECLTHSTWDEALRARLVEPLGLTHTSTIPEETMTRPLAVGHVPPFRGSEELVPVRRWQDARGSGPCGGTLATTASDLLAFARMHLRDGLADDGRRVLSAASAQAMRVPRVQQPDTSAGAWGWGWAIDRLDGPRLVGHIGSTAGQRARLVLVPEEDMAICVLATGDTHGLLRDGLSQELLRILGVADSSETGSPTTPSRGITDCVGSYRLDDETIVVTANDGGLRASFQIDGDEPADFRAAVPLEPVSSLSFRFLRPPSPRPGILTFVREDGPDGEVTHLAMSLRAFPRTCAL